MPKGQRLGPRPRRFCPHCGLRVAMENVRYGTIKAHSEPLDQDAKGRRGPICPGSRVRGLVAHPAQQATHG